MDLNDPVRQDLNTFIARIRDWYAEDEKGFATLFDEAIANVVPFPEDTPANVQYDWRDNTIDDLCNFFEEWYDWLWTAGPNEGLDYIEKFSWINYRNDYGMAFVTCGAGKEMMQQFTEIQGRQMDARGDRADHLIATWVEQLGTRMDDFEPGPWQTFNSFFTRGLANDSVRPIAKPNDNSVVVAPTDCVINMIVDSLTDDTLIPVKSVAMNVKQLLNDSEYAKKFVAGRDTQGQIVPGGTAVSCVLMPDTYHWYHAPVAGEVVESQEDVPGILYGMRDFPELLNNGNVGYGFDYQMFTKFHRGYLIFKTEFTDPLGDKHTTYVGMVTVGLNSIGSVNYLKEFKDVGETPVPVTKGEKIGNFMYGGSLNILLFEYGRFPALQLHMGQRIGTLEQRERTEGLFAGHHRAQSRQAMFLSF